ncbi:hypothetical protein ACJBVY_11635, partial [Streptococcus suis]
LTESKKWSAILVSIRKIFQNKPSKKKVERKLDEIKSNVSNISRNIQKNNETRQFDTTILPIEKVIPRLLDLGVDNPARLEALFAQVRSMLQQIRNIR